MATYKTFRNWDKVDTDFDFTAQNDRQIDDPGLNQDDSARKSQQEFDYSDDFHKNDDTDQDSDSTQDAENEGKFDGQVRI